MSDPCTRTFGDELLTGYVDRSLTQSDDQRVRIHLEDCETCRRAVAELLALRELTMTSTFKVPDDGQWDETPKNRASWAALSLGWILIIAVVTVWAVVAYGMFLLSPAPLIVKLLSLGGVAGVALVFGSALIDRLSVLKTDRYRGVRK